MAPQSFIDNGKTFINLGSPLARLRLETKVGFQDNAITLGTGDKGALELDLFTRLPSNAVINSIWGRETQGLLLSLPFELDGLPASPSPPHIRRIEGKIEIRKELLNDRLNGVNASNIAVTQKSLLSLSGNVPVLDQAMTVTFGQGSGNVTVVGDIISVPVKLEIDIAGEKITTLGKLEFNLPKPANGANGHYYPISVGDFDLLASAESAFTVEKDFVAELGDLLKLKIPSGSVFTLSLDPQAPSLTWNAEDSRKNTNARIRVSIPAAGGDDGFTFEMERFRIHSAGIDMRGAVRSGSVNLGDQAGFANAVGVKGIKPSQSAGNDESRPHEIGEIEFKNSRLVYGSLQASGKLPYFDDAVGTLTLFLSQGKASLNCAGTLDISGIDEFHIDALYATVQVDQLQFHIAYTKTKNSDSKAWQSKAAMTGRIKFQPPKGRSASEMGDLSALFRGVTLDFENLDPTRKDGSTWKLRTPPKRFTLADILSVDLRGIDIKLGQSRIEKCDLLGDISIQKMPGIDAALTFGGITLTPNGRKPSFKINTIAAQFTTPGGFRMSGELSHIVTPSETGFAGSFTLKTASLPEMGGLLKLTRVKLENGAIAPSLALFVERETNVHLMYGFYLRSLGIGLGVRQALRGLGPGSGDSTQRLIKLVENPSGLPHPARIDSWESVKRPKLAWMLVGAGLITFGNLPPDKTHLVAGNFLLSLDQDLRLLLAANLWLFTSPSETREARFIQRPVARGAIELSVRDGYLKAYLRTIKGPQLGKEAPPLLAEVLSKVETSLFYQVDRNGFIAEIGWPWETRIEYDKGEYFKGELQSGFRYGYYRGVLVYGLNFAMTVRLEASQRLAFGVRGASAEASLAVKGEADFRATFVGALDTKTMRAYLMGDVRLHALVSVQASASVRIKISKWIKIKIGFNATLNVTITAALTAALIGSAIGFEGTAEVAISVCGYGISGSVAFGYKPHLIETAREKLESLLADLPSASFPASLASPASASLQSDSLPPWRYRFHWLMVDGKQRVRVLLIPNDEYPNLPNNGPNDSDNGPSDSNNGSSDRFSLHLKPDTGATFKGFTGSETVITGELLTWSEDLDKEIPLDGLYDEETARAYLEGRKAELEGIGEERDGQEEKELTGINEALRDVRAALLDTDDPMINAMRLRAQLEDWTDHKPLNGRIIDHRLDPEYETKLAKASAAQNDTTAESEELNTKSEESAAITPGLLLAELVALLKDDTVTAGEDANASRPEANWYRAAHLMKFVLEFEVPADWRQRRDPVPDLIDLTVSHTLGGSEEARLEPPLGLDVPLVEYRNVSIVLGHQNR